MRAILMFHNCEGQSHNLSPQTTTTTTDHSIQPAVEIFMATPPTPPKTKQKKLTTIDHSLQTGAHGARLMCETGAGTDVQAVCRCTYLCCFRLLWA